MHPLLQGPQCLRLTWGPLSSLAPLLWASHPDLALALPKLQEIKIGSSVQKSGPPPSLYFPFCQICARMYFGSEMLRESSYLHGVAVFWFLATSHGGPLKVPALSVLGHALWVTPSLWALLLSVGP